MGIRRFDELALDMVNGGKFESLGDTVAKAINPWTGKLNTYRIPKWLNDAIRNRSKAEYNHGYAIDGKKLLPDDKPRTRYFICPGFPYVWAMTSETKGTYFYGFGEEKSRYSVSELESIARFREVTAEEARELQPISRCRND